MVEVMVKRRKKSGTYIAKVRNKKSLHKHVARSKSLHTGEKKAMHNIVKRA